jgi:hypothetical protein
MSDFDLTVFRYARDVKRLKREWRPSPSDVILARRAGEDDFNGVDLSYADLTGANLSSADLTYADLSYAHLSHADLTNTNLKYTVLTDAKLLSTCLDPDSPMPPFVSDLFTPDADGYFLAYRTKHSPYIKFNIYTAGLTYTAPYFSTSAETECHPGLYFSTRKFVEEEYPDAEMIEIRVHVSDALRAKGKYRCRKFEVVRDV